MLNIIINLDSENSAGKDVSIEFTGDDLSSVVLFLQGLVQDKTKDFTFFHDQGLTSLTLQLSVNDSSRLAQFKRQLSLKIDEFTMAPLPEALAQWVASDASPQLCLKSIVGEKASGIKKLSLNQVWLSSLPASIPAPSARLMPSVSSSSANASALQPDVKMTTPSSKSSNQAPVKKAPVKKVVTKTSKPASKKKPSKKASSESDSDSAYSPSSSSDSDSDSDSDSEESYSDAKSTSVKKKPVVAKSKKTSQKLSKLPVKKLGSGVVVARGTGEKFDEKDPVHRKLGERTISNGAYHHLQRVLVLKGTAKLWVLEAHGEAVEVEILNAHRFSALGGDVGDYFKAYKVQREALVAHNRGSNDRYGFLVPNVKYIESKKEMIENYRQGLVINALMKQCEHRITVVSGTLKRYTPDDEKAGLEKEVLTFDAYKFHMSLVFISDGRTMKQLKKAKEKPTFFVPNNPAHQDKPLQVFTMMECNNNFQMSFNDFDAAYADYPCRWPQGQGGLFVELTKLTFLDMRPQGVFLPDLESLSPAVKDKIDEAVKQRNVRLRKAALSEGDRTVFKGTGILFSKASPFYKQYGSKKEIITKTRFRVKQLVSVKPNTAILLKGKKVENIEFSTLGWRFNRDEKRSIHVKIDFPEFGDLYEDYGGLGYPLNNLPEDIDQIKKKVEDDLYGGDNAQTADTDEKMQPKKRAVKRKTFQANGHHDDNDDNDDDKANGHALKRKAKKARLQENQDQETLMSEEKSIESDSDLDPDLGFERDKPRVGFAQSSPRLFSAPPSLDDTQDYKQLAEKFHTLDDSQPIFNSSTANEKISLLQAVAKKLYPGEDFLSSVSASVPDVHLEMILGLLRKKLSISNSSTAKTVVQALLEQLNAMPQSMTFS